MIKEKILKIVVSMNIILFLLYTFDIVLRLFRLSSIFYQKLYNFPILYQIVYFLLSFIGLELLLISLIIFSIKPKLSKNFKILLFINLLIIFLSFLFLFISE